MSDILPSVKIFCYCDAAGFGIPGGNGKVDAGRGGEVRRILVGAWGRISTRAFLFDRDV